MKRILSLIVLFLIVFTITKSIIQNRTYEAVSQKNKSDAAEGTKMHTHQHLDLFISGQKVPVPQSVGINDNAGFISPIHTHDEDGIIHVESPTFEDFTLGQFFDIWGVRFNDECLGGYCNGKNDRLKVFVKGLEIMNNFRKIKLEPKQEIAIFYGSDSQSSSSVPSPYNFPAGY